MAAPRIDSSDEASYLASYGRLLNGRPAQEKSALLTAVYKIEAAAREAHGSFCGADEFARIGRESVHGMTYEDILDRADKLTTQRERRLAALDAKGRDAYESLSEPERVWFTVATLLFCIRDGGLPSYFYNGYSGQLADCMKSLKALDCSELLELVQNTSRKFRDREPTALATLGGLFTSSRAQAKESERELELAAVVEDKLNEYVAEHRIA